MRTAYVRFGRVKQERGEKHVEAGSLVSAINVRQTTKAGVYEKRRGFSATALLFSGATWSGATPVSCVGDGKNVGAYMRDSQDRLWSWRGTAADPWVYRGTQNRTWVKSTTISADTYATPQLCTVEVGDNVWAFAKKGSATVAGVNRSTYHLIITNKATGASVATYKDIVAEDGTSSTIDVGLHNCAACYDGTYVWLFYVALTGYASNKVCVHKFTAASPSSSPVQTTFYTAASPMNHVACQYNSTANVVLVAFGGLYAGAARLYHAQLDQATGLAKVSPAPQVVVNVATSLPIQALGFLGGQATNASVAYYHYYGFQTGGAGATYSGPVLVKITNIATLAYSTCLYTPQVGSSTEVVVASGVHDAATDAQVVIWGKDGSYLATTSATSGGPPASSWIGWTNSYAGRWLASGLARSGDYVYYLTGFDDISESAVPTGTALVTASSQRSFHLNKIALSSLVTAGTLPFVSNWNWGAAITAQACNGLGSARHHNATISPLCMYRTGTTQTLAVVRIPDLFISGTKFVATVGADAGVTGSVGVSRVEVETSRTWGKDCSANGRAVGPGNIPVVWSADNNAHEISPLLAPPFIYVAAAGTGTTYNSLAAVYSIRDTDGTIYRSAPCYLASTVGEGAQIRVPMLRHTLPGTVANIEFYVGKTAVPLLQTVVQNVVDGNQTVVFAVTAATYVDGEMLYTAGKALSQTWPPQCQAVGAWHNRLFLASKNAIWTSQETDVGLGFLFNEVLRSIWSECSDEINALVPVDWNYFALLGSGSVGVIDGSGPDQLGSGNYVVRTLSTKIGIVSGGVTANGAEGAFFQDSNTGRLIVVTPQLQALECAGGAYDYSGKTVSAISDCEAERQVRFFTTDGYVIVLDTQHKEESAPFGQVYVWTINDAAYAECGNAAGAFYVGSTGAVFYNVATFRDVDPVGTAHDYRMSIKTAPLQLANLQGAYDVSRVQVLGEFKAACSVKLTTYPDYAAVGDATTPLSVVSAPLQLMTRPSKCMMIQALAMQIDETAGTGAAFNFEGFAIEYLPRNRMKFVNTSQVVS